MRAISKSLRARLLDGPDAEFGQSLVRLLVIGLALAYFTAFHAWRGQWSELDVRITQVLVGFVALAIAILAAIWVWPGPNLARRIIGMLADVIGCTWYMAVGGEYGFFTAAIYVFIVLGYGFRYGPAYLFGCQGMCIAGMLWVLKFVPFWDAHRVAWTAMLMTVMVIPAYVAALVRKATARS